MSALTGQGNKPEPDTYLFLIIHRLMHTLSSIYYKVAHKLRTSFSRRPSVARDWYELVDVRPGAITTYSGRSRKKKEDYCCFGSRVQGEWDIQPRQDEYAFLFEGDLRECIFVQSLRDHFEHGKAWDDTEFIKIMKGTAPHPDWPSYKDKVLIERKCIALDHLFNSIETNGFKTAREIYSERLLPKTSFLDVCAQEVLIDISRNNEPLLFDGKHRFAISLILELKTIPVLILATHASNND